MAEDSFSPSLSDRGSATPEPKLPTKTANGTSTSANGRPVKRRASKACQCCRARKVRCNVVEHGAPCTNCRLDEVECIVTESKRRKKHHYGAKPLDTITEQFRPPLPGLPLTTVDALANGSINPLDISKPGFRRASESSGSMDVDDDLSHHVPHPLYQCQNQRLNETSRRLSQLNAAPPLMNLMHSASMHGDLMSSTRFTSPAVAPRPATNGNGPLPAYIKPLPPRMTSDDIQYLWRKGALSVPELSFRNALLQAYLEYVHPYMPLIELHDFLRIIEQNNGENGKISLVLFQAVMFAGTAFVDMSYLKAAGFAARKAARKAFYQKARLLYDFDYDNDRVALVQSLLLMTYWYETPDDQKDTWHWMGVAISLAHTIGLHRNPEKSNMDVKKQKLWKRIWWSCFMRDRLVALGMRRPTRIKDQDFDVPMLTLDDFELQPLASDNLSISPDCTLARDVEMQKELASLCIAKAKLCLIISHVLGAQYSVLVRDQGMSQGQEGNTRSSVMLFPKKLDQTDEVKACDKELNEWVAGLSAQQMYRPPTPSDIAKGRSSFCVQLALLHMVYFATLSALHRPQVLPSVEASSQQQCRDLQDVSRKKVREASKEITRMSINLHNLRLTRYLPTTGVTVLLPAIIIHLLDIKSCVDTTRDAALQGFCQCMLVLEKLRDNYAAADYAVQFLEAAIRKADIDIGRKNAASSSGHSNGLVVSADGTHLKSVPRGIKIAQNVSHLLDAGRAARLTPPPDHTYGGGVDKMDTDTFPLDASHCLHAAASASTPPDTDSSSSHSSLHDVSSSSAQPSSSEPDVVNSIEKLLQPSPAVGGGAFDSAFDDSGFDALIDYGVEMEDWTTTLEEGMHGESGGFGMIDVDFNAPLVEFDMWGTLGAGSSGGTVAGGTGSGLSEAERDVYLLANAS